MEYLNEIIWAGLLVLFIIIEAATAQLVTIWFAAGALVSLIISFFNCPIWLQIIVFVIVSAVTLIATRPLVRKLTKKNMQPTNADRCIGATAIVTEDINNILGAGAVSVNGVIWTARSESGNNYSKDEKVTVLRIEGVKLIVDSKED